MIFWCALQEVSFIYQSVSSIFFNVINIARLPVVLLMYHKSLYCAYERLSLTSCLAFLFYVVLAALIVFLLLNQQRTW